jgi:hypothetical protein
VGGNNSSYTLSGGDVGKRIKVVVTATNDAGQEDAESDLTEIVQPASPPPDTDPPDVTITGKPTNPSSDQTPQFKFTSSESGATFACSLDSPDFTACTSPKTYGPLADGTHTFKVFAVDGAGNGSAVETYTWKIARKPVNVDAPTISSPNGLKEGEKITGLAGNWDGTQPIDFAFEWFHCSPGGGGCEKVGSGQSYILGSDDVDLVMKLTVNASNEGGDASASSELTPVVVDETAPDIRLTSKPRALTNTLGARFAFTSSDPRASFMCKLNQGAFVPCKSPKRYPRLRAGRHLFQLRATDRSRKTVTTSYAWTIDRVRPPAPTRVALRGGDRNVTGSWGNPAVKDFGFVRVMRFASPGTIVYQGRGTRFRDRAVRNGKRYLYSIRAFDRAGNASAVVRRRIRPRDPLFTPRDGARVSVQRPPLVRWKRDPSARRYNVQLRRLTPSGWRKILSIFPAKPSYQLRRSWAYGGARRQFTAGVYIVHVWPWYGTRYGRMIGFNVFRGV